MIYKHISDIRHVTSVNNGENYVNLISTSAYRRRATTGTSKEDGADRWSLWAKLSARTHMCVGVCVCVCVCVCVWKFREQGTVWKLQIFQDAVLRSIRMKVHSVQ